jgi:hypothetical protein
LTGVEVPSNRLPAKFRTLSTLVTLIVDPENATEIARIRSRLASLDIERGKLATALAELERQQAASAPTHHREPAANSPTVTATSSTAVKVDLFRRLFVGRPDVFPIRWENRKAGRAGYAPACANEWAKGVFCKPPPSPVTDALAPGRRRPWRAACFLFTTISPASSASWPKR